MGRSLGDFWSFNDERKKYVVSPEPDVDTIRMDETSKCVIFATDGLWNVVTPKSAVQIVQLVEQNNKEFGLAGSKEFHNPSKILVKHAIDRSKSSKVDNISVVVAMIDQN